MLPIVNILKKNKLLIIIFVIIIFGVFKVEMNQRKLKNNSIFIEGKITKYYILRNLDLDNYVVEYIYSYEGTNYEGKTKLFLSFPECKSGCVGKSIIINVDSLKPKNSDISREHAFNFSLVN